MALSNEELDALIKSVSLTRTDEPTCDECLQVVAEFAELCLAGRSIPESLQEIERHLEFCTECREEYEALRKALKEAE